MKSISPEERENLVLLKGVRVKVRWTGTRVILLLELRGREPGNNDQQAMSLVAVPMSLACNLKGLLALRLEEARREGR